MTQSPRSQVSVIVPVFNKIEIFRTAANSVMTAARHSNAEVIFIDHGSTDGTREVLDTYRGAHVLDHRGGTVGSVRNAGARRARASILCFIDSDIVVKPDHFERVGEVLASSGAGAVGCEVDVPSDARWLEKTWHALNTQRSSGFRRYINAANMAVKRQAFDAIGGFDERLVSGEETDLCRRLISAGYTVYESKDLAATHLDNPKTLWAFFRKQIWHGLGVPSTDRSLVPNKPMAMATVHLFMLIVAVLILALPAGQALELRAFFAFVAILIVPMLAYAYRLRQTGRWVNILPALLLFEVFFLARGVAAVQIALQRIHLSSRPTSRTVDS